MPNKPLWLSSPSCAPGWGGVQQGPRKQLCRCRPFVLLVSQCSVCVCIPWHQHFETLIFSERQGRRQVLFPTAIDSGTGAGIFCRLLYDTVWSSRRRIFRCPTSRMFAAVESCRRLGPYRRRSVHHQAWRTFTTRPYQVQRRRLSETSSGCQDPRFFFCLWQK